MMKLKLRFLIVLIAVTPLNRVAIAAETCAEVAAIEGSVGWNVLGETHSKDQRIDGAWQTLPEFSAAVKALAGKTIKVTGYMLPLQSREGRSQFVLMARSPDCPASTTTGAEHWIQIHAATPVQYRREPMLLEGQLELVESDPDGIFYRLNNAHLIH